MVSEPNREQLTEDKKRSISTENLGSGGLLAIMLIFLQVFISAPSLDTPLFIAFLSFSIGIPLLAGKIFLSAILVNDSYYVRSRWFTIIDNLFVIGGLIAIIGITATLWHLSWIGSLLFLMVGVSMFILGYRYFNS